MARITLLIHSLEIRSQPEVPGEEITGQTYDEGVNRNGEADGLITIEITQDSPDKLYYQCVNNPDMAGTLIIIDGDFHITDATQTAFLVDGEQNPTKILQRGRHTCSLHLTKTTRCG